MAVVPCAPLDMTLTGGRPRVYTTERTKLKYVVQELLENNFVPEDDQQIVRVIAIQSNYLVKVQQTDGTEYYASIPGKYRNKIWIQNRQYVIVEPIAEGRKVRAEVLHVLFPEHMKYLAENNMWPDEFNPPFPDRYKAIRLETDARMAEQRKAEKEEEAIATSEERTAAVADRSTANCDAEEEEEEEEEEEDDDSDLFVNNNWHYLNNVPEYSTEEEDDDSDDSDDSDEKDCSSNAPEDSAGEIGEKEEEEEGEEKASALDDTESTLRMTPVLSS